ncbi:prolyl aminopeptidase [Alteromonas pelagimontana]|uniref:Proline iminopeptidase n=1 Tax=Alteromonas pelagimontana TaxID=1858656 RepID=A0A6M4ME38_9ALTE|nr:prolyl aminopeptidase [Alteromonas pelagimontana]QJR81454.1 prolyl aminopeptidase [Alteromonas pelagimontana]
MKRLYPDIGSYASGYLETDEEHSLYYEESGNPAGLPILYLHGGPGAGLSPNYRRFFDANHYRIVAFEQRGCGRSRPFGSLKNNTTADTLRDIQRLRQHLQIDSWVVFGGSWGATLALLSAMDKPEAVKGIILRGVFLGREEDRDWFLSPKGGGATLFPEHYDIFIDGIPPPLSTDVICQWYSQQFDQPDEVRRLSALKRWYVWEERLSRLALPPGTGDITAHYPVSLMTSLAKLECHYLTHHCFVPEDYILSNIDKISHIPGTIVHGRYDVICKTEAAYSLHKLWGNSELQIVPDAGHSTSEPGIGLALCRASRDMNRFLQEKKT